MLIDTHAHLNFPAFKDDADEVIRRSLENDIWMINVGSNFPTSKKAVEIAQKHERGVFAAVGLHPINLDTGLVKIKVDEKEGAYFEKEFDFEKYKNLAFGKNLDFRSAQIKELAKFDKVIAIGEIGSDYYWKPKTKRKLALFKEKQRELFLEEVKLAQELNLPIIFHCRMAHDDLIEILNYALRTTYYTLNAVMHGFVGTLGQLQEYLKMGFYIGFNGIIFKKIEGINFEENIKNTPLEKILIETDCPYLTPLPAEALAKAGPKEIRNEPTNVKYIAERIAEIKNITFEKVAEITTKNAKELFNI